MNEIFEKIGIDQSFTKQRYKKKRRKNVEPIEENHVKNLIPMKADMNFMIDTLHLPETKKGFKYLFVIVDLASDEFDIEPTRDLDPNTSLLALKNCLKRNYIKVDKNTFTVTSDRGNEWTGKFHQYLWNLNIFHKKSLGGRHTQTANVESLNKQLGRLFNGYMNMKEEETGKIYKEWDEVLTVVRKELNKYRKKKMPKDPVYQAYDFTEVKFETKIVKGKKKTVEYSEMIKSKFKIHDEVHVLLQKPKDALQRNQNTAQFRVGDFSVDKKVREVEQILFFPDEPRIRYLVSGIKNASFTEHELRKPSQL